MSVTAFDKQKLLREELAKTFKPKYREVPTQKWFSQLVNNGTNLTTTAGWTAAASGTLAVNATRLEVTSGGASFGIGYQLVNTIVGKSYTLTVDITDGTSTGGRILARRANNATVILTGTTVSVGTESHTYTFIALDSQVSIQAQVVSNTGTALFNNISIREAYILPSNTLVTKVFDNGSLLKPNTDYTIVDDGLTKTISFTVEPNALSDVLVEYWEQI